MKKISMDVYKFGTVVDLTLSRWGARAMLSAEELGLQDKEIPEIIYLGHKKLMKKTMVAKLNSVISRAEVYLLSHSFSFPFGNCRFVLNNMFDEVEPKMNGFKQELEEALDEFLTNYAKNREEMLDEYRKWFEEQLANENGEREQKVERLMSVLRSKYPDENVLRSKYNIDFSVFVVVAPDFDGMPLVRTASNAEYAQKINERLDRFLDDAVARLQGMVLDTTKRVTDLMEGGNLGGRTAKSFVRFANQFKKMDFIGFDIQADLDSLAKKLEEFVDDKNEKLPKKGVVRSDEQFKQELQDALQSIQDKVVNSDVVLGRFRRTIERENLS